VFNATFNNISVISWRSVLLVEETCVCNSTLNNGKPTVSNEENFYSVIYKHSVWTHGLVKLVCMIKDQGCYNAHEVVVNPTTI
jgi:hypothetical protein